MHAQVCKIDEDGNLFTVKVMVHVLKYFMLLSVLVTVNVKLIDYIFPNKSEQFIKHIKDRKYGKVISEYGKGFEYYHKTNYEELNSNFNMIFKLVFFLYSWITYN